MTTPSAARVAARYLTARRPQPLTGEKVRAALVAALTRILPPLLPPDGWDPGELEEQITRAVELNAAGTQLHVMPWSAVPRDLIPRLSRKFGDQLAAVLSPVAAARGWFLLTHERGQLTYTRNYDERVEELPPFLYHVTSAEAARAIVRRGFLRYHRSPHNRRYQGRVYLMTSERRALGLRDGFGMAHIDPEGGGYNGPAYVVITVARGRLPRGIKFYADPEFDRAEGVNAVYTYSDIPAAAVTEIEGMPADEWAAAYDAEESAAAAEMEAWGR